MAQTDRQRRWMVHGLILVAGLVVVLLNFGPVIPFGSEGGKSTNTDREALAKIAPTMTDKAYHRKYRSEDQCITCHSQQVLGAPVMPHEQRVRCGDCHKVASS